MDELDISKVKNVESLAYFDEPLAEFIESARAEYWFNENPMTPGFKISWQRYPTFAIYLATKIRAVAALMEMGLMCRGVHTPQS